MDMDEDLKVEPLAAWRAATRDENGRLTPRSTEAAGMFFVGGAEGLFARWTKKAIREVKLEQVFNGGRAMPSRYIWWEDLREWDEMTPSERKSTLSISEDEEEKEVGEEYYAESL
jgi:hypothetical protein